MRRYSILIMLAITMLLAFTSASLAVYPVPDDTATFNMQQGWYDGRVAWFICTDTNGIDWAKTPSFPYRQLTLAPKLGSGFYGAGVAAMFVVTNPDQSQGPIFETAPGEALYSGIWRVRSVVWNPGANKVPLTSIGQILSLQAMGQLNYFETEARVDCPIVALGPLGGSWLAKPYPPYYRIPQGITHNPSTKTITLPAWYVYCQDPITKKVSMCKIIIPDVGDEALASALGANYAPMLNLFPLPDRQNFYVMRPPKPVNQYPVIQDCPNGIGWRNTNFDYSPVMTYYILFRSPQIASTVINNSDYLEQLIGGPLQVAQSNQVINAPVIGCSCR